MSFVFFIMSMIMALSDKTHQKLLKENFSSNPTTCTCQLENDLETKEKPKLEDVETRPSIIIEPKFSKRIPKDADALKILQYMANIFERTMNKLELAATVPLLILDPKLSHILTSKELETVKTTFLSEKYSDKCSTYKLNSKGVHSISSCATIWPGSNLSLARNDPKIFDALQILNGYPEVREMVKSCQKNISTALSLFLHHMQFFLDYGLSQFCMTPEEERARDLHYRQAWRNNKNSSEVIRSLTKELETQRADHRKEMDTILTQYRRNVRAIEGINKKCSEDMKNTILRTERKQYLAYKVSEAKQNELKTVLTNARNDLDSLRDEHLRTEQSIRKRRLKVASQLQALINKFDTEIGARARLMEELEEIYENDKIEKATLQKEMESQQETYDAFVTQHELASQRAFREKIEVFTRTRSAKIIQRWWRQIYPRLKKKRRKKGKKAKRK